MSHLFSELTLRGVTLPNRIGVSPMCQYSCTEGFAVDWHFVHLGSRAVGGAGLVMTEAAAVVPEGRLSPEDLGAWSDAHFEPLERITRFITDQGSVPAIQLAHAGRKASTHRPWSGSGKVDSAEGGWTPLAPSSLAFSDSYPKPRAMTIADIKAVVAAFVSAAERAVRAGFRVIEIHAAHGYLFDEFLSPFSNLRTDAYGGSFENRTRFLRDTLSAIRAVLPDACPNFVRISSVDWTAGGWDIEQSVALARLLKGVGVDLIDCSSGGNLEHATIPVGAGYQLPFADRIRSQAEIATAAVGMITSPAQADQIVRNQQADLVLIARELLRDPYWPLHAAAELGHSAPWPAQYLRAAPKGTLQRRPSR